MKSRVNAIASSNADAPFIRFLMIVTFSVRVPLFPVDTLKLAGQTFDVKPPAGRGPNMKPKKKDHQAELNQLGAIAGQIFDGTSSASTTVTDLVLQEARASYCRLQIEEAEVELKKRVKRKPIDLRTIQDHLAYHKKELAIAEQRVKELRSQHESRN